MESIYYLSYPFQQTVYHPYSRPYNNNQIQPKTSKKQTLFPEMGVVETESQYMIEIDLPGVKKEDISLDYNPPSRELSLRAERKPSYQGEHDSSEGDKSLLKETRSFGTFERSLVLPEDSDGDKIEVAFNFGVLSIVIPKKVEVKPVKIQVK
jgi:HSP20 family protein